MLEGLVAWVLNNYLGKYVENLNTDQLSIALLSGEVELENLPLKREALRNIGLPLEVKAGFIGKVRLQVPVRQIRTASWVIAIEKLYLIAGPINLEEYDSEVEEHSMADYKLSRLEAIEARWRTTGDQDPSYYATSYTSWVTYGTSVMTNIVENLQLNIKDVHLRYEDDISLPGEEGTAFGIMIDALTAQSCDASWIPGSTSWDSSDASFKLMELNGLSAYWNQIKKDEMFHNLNLIDLAAAMCKSKESDKCYILSPVNARALIKRDRSEKPLRSVNKPRIVVDLSLDQVPLSITDEQHQQIVQCIRGLEDIDRRKRQRKYRPSTSIKDSPRDWWIYAARCYLGKSTFLLKKTWSDIFDRGRKNIIYVDTYVKLLNNPTMNLPPDIKAIKDHMELKLSFDELRVLREIAMLRVRPPKPVQQESDKASIQPQGILVQWFPMWWGWYSKETDASNNSTSSTFDGELLDVLSDTIDDDTLLRRDTVFGQFNFALSKGAISFCKSTRDENGKNDIKTIMELQFEKVHLSYESRPRSSSHKFSISLGALYLHDYFTENSTFPILIQPQTIATSGSSSRLRSSEKLGSQLTQSLFELTYEKKPLHISVDHSLHVTSRSLDVVYNPMAFHWLIDFMYEPYRSDSSNQRLQAMKRKTRKQIMKNWEHILEGDIVYRSSWDLQLNISAPQILLVEKFTDNNAIVLVVDFGRLHLTNNIDVDLRVENTRHIVSPTYDPEKDEDGDEDEEDERYETPCSTPPGSQENGSIQEYYPSISENALHKKLYDHYTVDLSDLQILVGKVKDNWKHARMRGMSSLHVLERFNISLQLERRVFHTMDPQFPSIKVFGNLPRLVVHINESKVETIRSMYNLLTSISSSSPVSMNNQASYMTEEPESPKRGGNLDKKLNLEMLLQFTIEQMTFELQSRGRSVAELQVFGVKAAMSKTPTTINSYFSVHGLLLVDALQEFGPDFELLVASHKHVGMDSISGSLRDSEPTSPISPVSPGSPDFSQPLKLTSPIALTHALTSLVHRGSNEIFSPKNDVSVALEHCDNEALIVVEFTYVDEPQEKSYLANILFNNLDIIANQETIVELIGFIKRILPSKKRKPYRMERYESITSLSMENPISTRTEIGFVFRRLNVLLLRAVLQDSHLVGHKIATATMCDARIHASYGANYNISGALGGLQILDQTLAGKTHQRIISTGKDPLGDPSRSHNEDLSPMDRVEAFNFVINKSKPSVDSDESMLDVSIRIGSVWYTHASHLLSELRSCADEFKQYFSNLAKQISAVATDMAIGLVNAEEWALPQRKRLPSFSMDGNESFTYGLLKLNIIIDSPVLVIPRSSQSTQVFVAHLGTMTLKHDPPISESEKQKINLEIKDINLHSLDVSNVINRNQHHHFPLRAEDMYACKESGKPILHDTFLKIIAEREIGSRCQSPGFPIDIETSPGLIEVKGIIVTPLKVSLSRTQYEQLLDTVNRLLPESPDAANATASKPNVPMHNEKNFIKNPEPFIVPIKVRFDLPMFSVELRQEDCLEQPLVSLSMRDFIVKYEKLHQESIIEVSLRSLLMEDLLCPVGSKHRYMMQSSAPSRARLRAGVSKSCPDLTITNLMQKSNGIRGSLPDRLETDTLYGAIPSHWKRKPIDTIETPNTPPPSPGAITVEENLVLISITTIQKRNAKKEEVIQKTVSVDFNCLDLVVSIESWMVVLDFLGASSTKETTVSPAPNLPPLEISEVVSQNVPILYSDTRVEINSLTLVLTQADREIAKANISNVNMHLLKDIKRTKVSGSLGSVSLLDLTPHGRFYRERFLSSGEKALYFEYSNFENSGNMPYDAKLKLQMSAVHYIHTQRFVFELQNFILHFSQLRSVMSSLRAEGDTVFEMNKRDSRLLLELHAGAPVILLPVSSRSEQMILLNLGELTAHNIFLESDIAEKCLLDVMNIELVNMDVHAAKRVNSDSTNDLNENNLMIGGFIIQKIGSSLLTEKCHLNLEVKHNLDSYLSRAIPDWSISGKLSTMEFALDTSQYMLIRGLLAYNISENCDDLKVSVPQVIEYSLPESEREDKIWTKSYLNLELVNVTLKLYSDRNKAALACVNFIKSKLIIDTLSNGSQDIDLVSREILITDTRFEDKPVNQRSNVFTSILQPLRQSSKTENRVQAEIHHRKRQNFTSTTVLLHSMRLTAILDWLEAVKDFLMLQSSEPDPILFVQNIVNLRMENEMVSSPTVHPFELKLNITDSEFVLVEDTSLWDTNAVILKCTAILTYKSSPLHTEKPLTCNLSHCEFFSCILGLEEETALSIIDPVGANIELTSDKCLEIQMQPLSVRLSYTDVNMFLKMLNSLPKQTLLAKQKQVNNQQPANAKSHIMKLSALGFNETDCERALEECNGYLDDAALWLTQNAIPDSGEIENKDQFPVQLVELETPLLKICIIDDCRDSDVPLLELTLADVSFRQEYYGPGDISATFTLDYYNRVLSGWEPVIEPWRATIQWEQTVSSGTLNFKRLRLRIDSVDSVDVNITSTLIDLISLVKENWTQDYLCSSSLTANKVSGTVQSFRRRSPFVPFAIKNETGSKLYFKTLIATAEDDQIIDQTNLKKSILQKDESWMEVPSGETVPFTFENRGKLRHQTTHVARRHQVAVLVNGWKIVDPVTIDKVGNYFRYAEADLRGSEILATKTRIIFSVELEGSARKLVTVKSALQVNNRLNYAIDLKLEKLISYFGYSPTYSSTLGGRILQVPAKTKISIPLTHTSVQMFVRPVHPTEQFQYCLESIDWSTVKRTGEVSEISTTCKTNQQKLFRICTAIRRNNFPPDRTVSLPGHTITILAPMTLTNLLPHEIHFTADNESDRIAPGKSADLHSLDINKKLEIVIHLDGYPGSGTLIIPENTGSFTGRLILSDLCNRSLHLFASVQVEKGSAIQINLTAPYWIINKTGLPLVFKQEGATTEFAGQFEEHEKARMIAPLLFSFNEEEIPGTLAVRVGTGLHPNGVPQWCQHFHLQPGIQVHRLRVSLRDGRPDIVYLIGISSRAARGRYRATTVVTLSPRYQLHNKSSSTLEIAQKCFTTTITDPVAQATYITAMSDCHMPFHWPRLDKDQLLCVRIVDVPNCMWSGGILLHGNHSLTINIRDISGKMYFLRVDVILQESTYFIIFTNADTMPPPIRVDNFSEVPLTINQISVPESLQWTVRPHCSVPYALDEPVAPLELVVTAPGGVSAAYDLNILRECKGLTYENFIYIAFTGTFKSDGELGSSENNFDPLDVETQCLVLEAGPGDWVSLRRKQYGARSQLWRMTGDGQLQHEGSSPPRDKHSRTPDSVLVLDISGTAPQPFTYCPLALRKPDPRRRSTQTWRFTDDGRLCCLHANMCVQSKDGFMGLQEGSEAVLGPKTNCYPPPIEQQVGKQRLRPGSGYLSIRVTTDGPTRVLQILDIKERKKTYALLEERDWSNISVNQRPKHVDVDLESHINARELHLSVDLPSGLGLSVISRNPVEELIFCRFAGTTLDYIDTIASKSLDLCIADVQVDNQLFEAQCTSVLCASRNVSLENSAIPALHIASEKLPSKSQNAEIYKHLIISIKPISVHLEERLILKFINFIGYGDQDQETPVDENDFNAQRFIRDVSASHSKRYYFGAIKLTTSQIVLSLITSNKLPPHLQAIKKKFGFTFLNFENVAIELEPFIRKHLFESRHFLIHSIIKFYKDELKWQAAVILGSFDFIGDPYGLVTDVSAGVVGLLEGNVKSLVKNVTHGLSNSAAKLADTLSSGIGKIIIDERHEEARQKIRTNLDGSQDHAIAGVKFLGLGLLGGITSIFKQTYDGAINDGIPGFVTGLGKGVVGTVAKPVAGILDFATEEATALRVSTTSAERQIPRRDRLPRVANGPAGFLPLYNRQQAEGQEFLYNINNRDYSEIFVAYECLRSGTDNLKVLVSSDKVRVISGGTKGVVTEVSLADLLYCQPTLRIESNGLMLHYIELTSRADSLGSNISEGPEFLRRPKVRCDSAEVANWVSRQINYAKGMHEERRLTLMSPENILDDN